MYSQLLLFEQFPDLKIRPIGEEVVEVMKKSKCSYILGEMEMREIENELVAAQRKSSFFIVSFVKCNKNLRKGIKK